MAASVDAKRQRKQAGRHERPWIEQEWFEKPRKRGAQARVEVDEECIDKGICGDQLNCPIQIAVLKQMCWPKGQVVRVYGNRMSIYWGDNIY